LDQLHLDSVNVLGWSDGGNTGLIMAMKYPAKVRRLAAMGANVFIDPTVVDGWVFRTLHKEQRELKDDSTAGSRNRDRLITLLLTEPRHRFEELAAIQCPVLVMAGQKDIIKEPHTRQIAAHIKNSRLLIFPGGTHYEPWEHPDLFNKAVLDFLQTN
ncbi:MAG TPA: alpha/beta hydrolase, partial [Puia sp.]|nr:alpha/beta hydrolase [Puia sp.]